MIEIIYNANSGKWQGLLDSGHKLLSPSTYSCDVCKLTYGLTSMKSSWKSFLDEIDKDVLFYHKDEWPDSAKYELPVIIKKKNGKTVEWVLEKKDFETIKNLDGLIELVKMKNAV